MSTFSTGVKEYEVDESGFLVYPSQWDHSFAEAMSAQVEIPDGLTSEHWEVLHYIRKTFEVSGISPTAYETCRACRLRLKELRRLFPTGYLRGACRLAGVSYRDTHFGPHGRFDPNIDLDTVARKKVYEIDGWGFLRYPDEWDEYFAVFRAREMRIPGGQLTDQHWKVIRFLREAYEDTGSVPTVYGACEGTGITLDELEALFPDGYHRGAVKAAGLRVP